MFRVYSNAFHRRRKRRKKQGSKKENSEGGQDAYVQARPAFTQRRYVLHARGCGVADERPRCVATTPPARARNGTSGPCLLWKGENASRPGRRALPRASDDIPSGTEGPQSRCRFASPWPALCVIDEGLV